MRAYSNVARSRHRDTVACPLFIYTKKWERAGSQHALPPERWGDVTPALREHGE